MKDNTAWPDLLQDPKPIRVHHCNSAEQIEAATDIIQQSTSQLYGALHDRAKLLANSAQFEAALRDATVMRKLRPTVALGYLCEADIYCRQGRFAVAMAIYDMGLEAVLPSDPGYHLLYQHRMAANNISNKRIDFISHLPVDVVSTNIIPRFMPNLLSTGCCPYLYVSHTWQRRILQHGLSFEVDYEDKYSLRDHEQLVRYAPYVKCLDLTVNVENHLVRILSLAKFSSLTKLKLVSNTRASQLNGLEMVSDTLTHLDLSDESSLHLLDIMKTCPNLTSLKFCFVDAVIPSSTESALQYPQLTHLAIQLVSPEIVHNDNLIRIFSMFPQLVFMGIGIMPDSSILPLLQKHCQHLRMIDFGHGMETRHPIIDVKDKGITVAPLGHAYHFKQDDMIKFLLQHCHTLMELDLRIHVTTDWCNAFEFVDGKVINREQGDGAASIRVSFPSLHTLHLAEGFLSERPFLQWIIDHSPQLRSISIPEHLFVKEMVPGLKRLQHLTSIHIYEVEEFEETSAAIGDFVQHHSALGGDSTLQHVKVSFRKDQVPMVSWVVFMCGLKRLEKLELLASTMMNDWDPFFIYLGRGCLALEELTLGKQNAFIVGSLIKAFCTYPNLRSLYIGASSLIECDLRCLARCPNLERVYLSFPLQDHIANYLHEHGIITKPFPINTPEDIDNKH